MHLRLKTKQSKTQLFQKPDRTGYFTVNEYSIEQMEWSYWQYGTAMVGRGLLQEYRNVPVFSLALFLSSKKWRDKHKLSMFLKPLGTKIRVRRVTKGRVK